MSLGIFLKQNLRLHSSFFLKTHLRCLTLMRFQYRLLHQPVNVTVNWVNHESTNSAKRTSRLGGKTLKFDTWNIDIWGHVSLSLGGETSKFDTWNIGHLTSCENMFLARPFTGRCNRRVICIIFLGLAHFAVTVFPHLHSSVYAIRACPSIWSMILFLFVSL